MRMIRWGIVLAVAILAAAFMVETSPETQAAHKRMLAEQVQDSINGVVQRTLYIQDPRTTPPTCFAWNQVMVSLSVMPDCDRIPKELLSVAR